MYNSFWGDFWGALLTLVIGFSLLFGIPWLIIMFLPFSETVLVLLLIGWLCIVGAGTVAFVNN